MIKVSVDKTSVSHTVGSRPAERISAGASGPFSRSRRSERGVAVIYFAMTFGVLLSFLMLVINTGMLIYQKIRLQTVVDLASYAGASVQASYLGNLSSGEHSIRSINSQMMKRYGDLLEKDLRFGTVAPWPVGFPEFASCAAACAAANIANGNFAASRIKRAASDLEKYRDQIDLILSQMPAAARSAAEQTIQANIPELSIEGSGFGLSAPAGASKTTNKADDVVRSSQNTNRGSRSGLNQAKNAVLSFTTEKGMYLANVVAAIPHTFAYFGPACFPAVVDPPSAWFCTVNGAGLPGGPNGQAAAALALSTAIAGIGNANTLPSASDTRSNAIRLHYVLNAHRPEPFFIAAAEWHPENGSFANLENSFGAQGSIFPKETKLVAFSAAEPFGSDLLKSEDAVFGVRLQSLRKILLDPRLLAVKEDYPNLFDYLETLAPRDAQGRPAEKGADVARRFMH